MKNKYVLAIVFSACIISAAVVLTGLKINDNLKSLMKNTADVVEHLSDNLLTAYENDKDKYISKEDLYKLIDELVDRAELVQSDAVQKTEKIFSEIKEDVNAVSCTLAEKIEYDKVEKEVTAEREQKKIIDSENEKAKDEEFQKNVLEVLNSLASKNFENITNYYSYNYEIASPAIDPIVDPDIDDKKDEDPPEPEQEDKEPEADDKKQDEDDKEQEESTLVLSDDTVYGSDLQINFTAEEGKEYVFAVEMFDEQLILAFPDNIDVYTISVQLYAGLDKSGEVIMDPDENNAYISSEPIDGEYYVVLSGLSAGTYEIGIG